MALCRKAYLCEPSCSLIALASFSLRQGRNQFRPITRFKDSTEARFVMRMLRSYPYSVISPMKQALAGRFKHAGTLDATGLADR
jgi:hypothetical protein